MLDADSEELGNKELPLNIFEFPVENPCTTTCLAAICSPLCIGTKNPTSPKTRGSVVRRLQYLYATPLPQRARLRRCDGSS